MSQEITCKNCQFSNPHGSKFCSNCGDKLPLSTHILCPNCHTSNQIDRIFCDNCGTRLVQDSPIIDDEPEPEEDAPEAPQPFSLPSRRPGETGELSPNLLPEWLRTGETHSIEDDEKKVQEENAEVSNEKSEISTDELTKIDDLKSESSMSDDLPEWLLDQVDSDPIIPQSAGITTELYLDLVNNPELPDIEDEVTRINDEAGESANLPDWLQNASGKSEPAVDEEPEFEDEEGLDSDLDILAGLTDILAQQTDELIPPSESGIGLTDWLTEPDSQDTASPEDDLDETKMGITDWLSAPVEDESPSTQAPSEQGSGLTEILNDPDPFLDSDFGSETAVKDGLEDLLSEPDVPSSGGEAPAKDGAGLTDWLTNLDELESPEEGGEDWLGELANDDETGVDDWLSGLNQLTESQMNLEDSTDEADSDDGFEEDWLADLANPSSESTGTSDKEDSLSVTDWLTDSDTLDQFEEQISSLKEVDEAGKSESGAEDDLFGDLFSDDLSGTTGELDVTEEEEELPDWLSEGISAEIETSDNDAIQSELDWMFETGDLTLPENEQSADESQIASQDAPASEMGGTEEGFDWLSDIEDINTGQLVVPEYKEPEDSSSEELDIETGDAGGDEPIQQDEASVENDEPAASKEVEAPIDNDAESWEKEDESIAEDGASGELPEWMDALGPPVSQTPSEPPPIESEQQEIESELPDWLTQMRPGEAGLIGSSLPSALNPDMVSDSLELPDLSMELNKADLPDWLSAEGGGLPSALEEDNNAAVPSWLADSEDGDQGSPGSEWDSSLLDKLPPAPPEPELVEATIPDWLERFKPEELKTGETAVVAPQQTPTVEMESQDGMVAGLRGIINIEHAILPTAPKTAPIGLEITPNQTKQIELLRQLIDEEEESAQPEEVDATVRLPNLWNLLIIFLLFIVASIFWSSPGRFPLSLSPPSLGNNGAYELIEATSNQSVLVAFEHTPGMSGELTYQTATILSMLESQDNEIIPVTQHATTVGLMSTYEEINRDNILFLPGEAIGLRLLGDCINGDSSACQAMPNLAAFNDVTDVDLIILITSERDTLVNWIEQVSTITATPIIVNTTNSLEPLVTPYVFTEQVNGVMTHESLVAQQLPEGETRSRLIQQANASASVQLVSAVLLLASLVGYGFIRPTSTQGRKGSS